MYTSQYIITFFENYSNCVARCPFFKKKFYWDFIYVNFRFDNDEKTEATHFRILDFLKLISARKECGIVDARFHFMYFIPIRPVD